MDYLSTYTSVSAIEKILGTEDLNFLDVAREICDFQQQNNPVYAQWVKSAYRHLHHIGNVTDFPFLPISFFKTHTVIISGANPEIIFTSSGTTGMTVSRHPVLSAELYRQSFLKAFERFYGQVTGYAIIGLLPSYLDREGSSLVYMTEELVRASGNADSGLYLHDFAGLSKVLERREQAGQKTWMIGVTFALLDFAGAYPMALRHTYMLETGGMKGRRKELTRLEVQAILKTAFQLPLVHSEYGMTELLSQAYSFGNGIFRCPPWMKVLVRNEDDPMQVERSGTGALCIIDLANANSCSFIATEDLAKVYEDGSFEILGRLDNSDVRGCSLLAL